MQNLHTANKKGRYLMPFCGPKITIKLTGHSTLHQLTGFVISKDVLVVVVRHVDVVVVQLVLRLPRHLVLLFEATSRVGKPGAHLCAHILHIKNKCIVRRVKGMMSRNFGLVATVII